MKPRTLLRIVGLSAFRVSQVWRLPRQPARGSMSLLASGYRSIPPRSSSHLYPWWSPHRRPWCIRRPSSWERSTTGIMGPILGTGAMGTATGTGGIILTIAGTVGTAGSDEAHGSAWVSREDVSRGTP